MVKVRVDPHPYFRREGKDVLIDVPISIPEAVLGGKVEVPTVSGKRVTVKVPPGTSSGSRIRLPGMGVAGGDQYLVMKVVVPKGQPDEDTRADRGIRQAASGRCADRRAVAVVANPPRFDASGRRTDLSRFRTPPFVPCVRHMWNMRAKN